MCWFSAKDAAAVCRIGKVGIAPRQRVSGVLQGSQAIMRPNGCSQVCKSAC